MKVPVVLLSVISGAFAALDWAIELVKSETVRVRRQVGSPFLGGLGGSGEACVLRCLQGMSASMGSWAEEPSGLLAASLFSEEHLDEFCGIYTQGKGCMAACPTTNTQTMLLKAFASLDYLCVERYDELRSHLPCFQATHTNVQSQCNPKCGDLDKLKRLQQEQQMAQLMRNLDQMTHTMAQVCGILECQVSCQEPILLQLCPNDSGAAKFMQGFARQSMLATQRMLEDAGASRLWPEECRKLALDKSVVGDMSVATEYETYEEDQKIISLAAEPAPPEDPAFPSDADYADVQLLDTKEQMDSKNKVGGAIKVGSSSPKVLPGFMTVMLIFVALLAV